jgi:hypothetical protein
MLTYTVIGENPAKVSQYRTYIWLKIFCIMLSLTLSLLASWRHKDTWSVHCWMTSESRDVFAASSVKSKTKTLHVLPSWCHSQATWLQSRCQIEQLSKPCKVDIMMMSSQLCYVFSSCHLSAFAGTNPSTICWQLALLLCHNNMLIHNQTFLCFLFC